MIAMAVALVVMAGVYLTFDYQSAAYEKQVLVSELNNHLNGAFFFMERDLRLAGYDPLFDPATTTRNRATITDADNNTIQFQYDLNSDGILDDTETVRYLIVNHNLVRREYRSDSVTGVPDAIHVHEENVAEHIELIEFCYVLDDGTVTASLNTQVERDRIRAVFVSALFRTSRPVKGQRRIEAARSAEERADLYSQASNDLELIPEFDGTRPAPWDPPVDRFIRKLRIVRIGCRNMGLGGEGLGF